MTCRTIRCWFLLFLAVLLELLGTTALKFFSLDDGMTGYGIMLACILVSYWLLSKAIEVIPVSTAYAIWEGTGLIGVTIVAYLLFHESLHPLKLLAFAAIIAGLLMIKSGTSVAPPKEESTYVS